MERQREKREGPFLVLTREDVSGTITMAGAIAAVRDAFASVALGSVRMPEAVGVEIPEAEGEFHVKAGHIRGTAYFVVKVASGFWGNRGKGIAVGSGLMLAFDATTGFPRALILDGGLLTELRTAAAGALAADYLARRELRKIAILGSGTQARFQLQALSAMRSFQRVAVWSPTSAHAERFAQEMSRQLDLEVAATATVESAVSDADLVITVTPARSPVLRGEWLSPGAHVNAIGADAPEKRELDARAFERADIVVADSIPQCLRIGELHHAVAEGALRAEDVDGELGDIVVGRLPGRRDDDAITICDLTGLGAQDAAIATAALESWRRGTRIPGARTRRPMRASERLGEGAPGFIWSAAWYSRTL